MNPLWYVTGYRKYRIPEEEGRYFLNLCMKEGLVYSHFAPRDGQIFFCCPEKTARRLESRSDPDLLHLTPMGKYGLPSLLWRNRFRAGLLLGLLLSALAGFLLTRMVWFVSVTGNDSVSTVEVLAELKQAGLSVGSLRSQINTDDVELKLLMASDKLSWVSVNLSGTVARVQVREKNVMEDEKEQLLPANLIAGSAGKILYTRILRGNAVVMAGDTVSEGDLLISGMFDSTSVGFRWTRASGQVFAQTVREFCVEVPLFYTDTEVSVTDQWELVLSFFGKDIKVFKSTGNPEGTCDTIETVRDYCFADGKTLPVSARTVRYVTCSPVSATRTPEQAERIAYVMLAGQISEWLGEGGSLLRKTVTVHVTQDSLMLYCTAVGVIDIAVLSEFEIDFTKKGS